MSTFLPGGILDLAKHSFAHTQLAGVFLSVIHNDVEQERKHGTY